MIITKKHLDTNLSDMFLHSKDTETAKAEILVMFSKEPDEEHEWSEQEIYEQIRKIVRKYE